MKRFDSICKRVKCKHRVIENYSRNKSVVICEMRCDDIDIKDCELNSKCSDCKAAITGVPLRCPYSAEMAVKQ